MSLTNLSSGSGGGTTPNAVQSSKALAVDKFTEGDPVTGPRFIKSSALGPIDIAKLSERIAKFEKNTAGSHIMYSDTTGDVYWQPRTTLGKGAYANNDQATAIGQEAKADANGIAIGNQAGGGTVYSIRSNCIGLGSSALSGASNCSSTIAIGNFAGVGRTDSTNSLLIGTLTGRGTGPLVDVLAIGAGNTLGDKALSNNSIWIATGGDSSASTGPKIGGIRLETGAFNFTIEPTLDKRTWILASQDGKEFKPYTKQQLDIGLPDGDANQRVLVWDSTSSPNEWKPMNWTMALPPATRGGEYLGYCVDTAGRLAWCIKGNQQIMLGQLAGQANGVEINLPSGIYIGRQAGYAQNAYASVGHEPILMGNNAHNVVAQQNMKIGDHTIGIGSFVYQKGSADRTLAIGTRSQEQETGTGATTIGHFTGQKAKENAVAIGHQIGYHVNSPSIPHTLGVHSITIGGEITSPIPDNTIVIRAHHPVTSETPDAHSINIETDTVLVKIPAQGAPPDGFGYYLYSANGKNWTSTNGVEIGAIRLMQRQIEASRARFPAFWPNPPPPGPIPQPISGPAYYLDYCICPPSTYQTISATTGTDWNTFDLQGTKHTGSSGFTIGATNFTYTGDTAYFKIEAMLNLSGNSTASRRTSLVLKKGTADVRVGPTTAIQYDSGLHSGSSNCTYLSVTQLEKDTAYTLELRQLDANVTIYVYSLALVCTLI